MLKITVIGAAGRMGQRLVANIMAADDLELAGALERPECPALGEDAGLVAGAGKAGVKISCDARSAFEASDAVIVFATGGVEELVECAVECGCSAVVGTTALSADTRRKFTELGAVGARIVHAPNMSVGVNLLFHLVKEAAKLLDGYDVEIVEMHHNQKKDAPSGTAVRLAEVVCEARHWQYDQAVRNGRQGMTGARTDHEIGMHALRGGDVVGDHIVTFASAGERVELAHKASSRDNFAKGALRAVRFLAEAKPGLYDMQQVLNLK